MDLEICWNKELRFKTHDMQKKEKKIIIMFDIFIYSASKPAPKKITICNKISFTFYVWYCKTSVYFQNLSHILGIPKLNIVCIFPCIRRVLNLTSWNEELSHDLILKATDQIYAENMSQTLETAKSVNCFPSFCVWFQDINSYCLIQKFVNYSSIRKTRC